MSQIVSVNIAQAQTLQRGDTKNSTGIFKQPQDGPVELSSEGLAADFIGDKVHHGGKDQAVYLYSQRDYLWWEQKLGRPLSPGTFGENLTLSDWGPRPFSALAIGDRLAMGEVILELTAPRIPCGTFAARMQDPQFVKSFIAAERPGVYARVIQTGMLQRGQTVKFESATQGYSLLDCYRLWYDKQRSTQALQQALKAPLAERARAHFVHLLQQIETEV